jgi:hypothetical protein
VIHTLRDAHRRIRIGLSSIHRSILSTTTIFVFFFSYSPVESPDEKTVRPDRCFFPLLADSAHNDEQCCSFDVSISSTKKKPKQRFIEKSSILLSTKQSTIRISLTFALEKFLEFVLVLVQFFRHVKSIGELRNVTEIAKTIPTETIVRIG